MMIDRHINEITEAIRKINEEQVDYELDFEFLKPEWFRKSVNFIDITNIAEYIFNSKSGPTREHWDFKKDFPNIILPWTFMWVEYMPPFRTFVDTNDIKLSKIAKNIGIYGGVTRQITNDKLITFMEHFILFVETKDNKVMPIATILIELDMLGRFNEGQFHGIRPLINLPSEMQSEYCLEINNLMAVNYLAISFCHCKNIQIVKENNKPKLHKSRIKKGKQPLIRFNTIQIDPMKEILKHEGQSEKTGLKKALHICRGHFATYTQEAPLFGRVTGTFWKPMHVRGNKKEGVVIKDYRIIPPAR